MFPSSVGKVPTEMGPSETQTFNHWPPASAADIRLSSEDGRRSRYPNDVFRHPLNTRLRMKTTETAKPGLGYGLDNRGSIPGRSRVFVLLGTASRPDLGPTQPPIQ